ncbi:hypothetical protein [Marinobacter sp. AN1]|uniref:hypothetical protein n=1 Tax=Marinobacter sp. AN1 TaxID=2886046 RepID=UPI00222EAFE9|nr:hypothetical protein [Marinobacter sp. AN1]UZD66514.1 hypothetical protein LJ360_03965 [Marinobacter sp. AN1]
MIRFRDGFFWKNENRDYAWVGTLKLFHLSSGFTAIDHYGTSDEYQTLEDTPQTKREYGTNATIVNVGGGGLSSPRDLFLVESTFVSELKSSGWGKTAIQAGRAMSKSASASFSDLYERDEWIGVELVSDLGDVGEANGSTQVYLYSQKGEQIGYWSAFNYNKLRHFDHKYNKFVFGGNRLCFNYGSCQEGLDSRYYVDDFIIHGDRIAPTYFELKSRKGSNDLKPNPPENINIK